MKTKILTITLGAVLAVPAAVRGAGTSAAPFLTQEPTARVTAMGGASAALYDEAGAVYFNPAGLGFAEGHRLSFSAWGGVDEKSNEAFVSGVFDAGKGGGFALSYLRHTSGDEDIYDLSGNLSTVELASEYALGAGWGHSLSRVFALGGQLKVVKSTLAEDYDAKAVTVDLGLLARTRNERFSLGLGVRNAGGELKYIDEGDPLPQLLYGGAAMRFPAGRGRFLLAADLHKPRDQKGSDIHAGLEYGASVLAVRVGARRAAGENAFTAGGGVKIRQFSFDYGFQAAGKLDQPLHKFALSVLFGGAERAGMEAAR